MDPNIFFPLTQPETQTFVVSDPPTPLDPDLYDEYGFERAYSCNREFILEDPVVPIPLRVPKGPNMDLVDGCDEQLAAAIRNGHNVEVEVVNNRPPSPTSLHPHRSFDHRAYPGEYAIADPQLPLIIECYGCTSFACLSATPVYLFQAVSEDEAMQYFKNHDLLWREKICECGALVTKNPNDGISCHKECPSCGKPAYFGPPLTDGYGRFTALQVLLLIVGIASRMSTLLLCRFVGASRPTVTRKKNDLFTALADAHVQRASRCIVTFGQGDETCFGRRKNNRGKPVNNHMWCQTLVSVDEDTGRTIDAFLRPVPNRKAETMVPWLRNLLSPDALLVTDEFKSYMTMCGFVDHRTVCHKVEFKTDDGFHTNNVEGFHGLIKTEVALRGRKLGRGFVNRAICVTALAELVSGSIRGIGAAAQICGALKNMIRNLRVRDFVGLYVKSWEVVRRAPMVMPQVEPETDNAHSDSDEEDEDEDACEDEDESPNDADDEDSEDIPILDAIQTATAPRNSNSVAGRHFNNTAAKKAVAAKKAAASAKKAATLKAKKDAAVKKAAAAAAKQNAAAKKAADAAAKKTATAAKKAASLKAKKDAAHKKAAATAAKQQSAAAKKAATDAAKKAAAAAKA